VVSSDPPWQVLVASQHPAQVEPEHPPASFAPLELLLLLGLASPPSLLIEPELPLPEPEPPPEAEPLPLLPVVASSPLLLPDPEPPLLLPEPDPPLIALSEPASPVAEAEDLPPHPESDTAKNSAPAPSPRVCFIARP
jgi:hypothetical protein